MAEQGIVGGGLVLELTNAAGVFEVVEGLLTCTPPTPSVASADSTDQASGNIDEFLFTRISPGAMAGTVKYVPGNTTHALLKEHLLSREKRPVRLTQPGAEGSPARVTTATGGVETYNPDNGAVGTVRTSSFSIKISGSDSEADAA